MFHLVLVVPDSPSMDSLALLDRKLGGRESGCLRFYRRVVSDDPTVPEFMMRTSLPFTIIWV